VDCADLGQRKPHAFLETRHYPIEPGRVVIKGQMKNHDPHLDELGIRMTVNGVSMRY
jgi:hypothetical protein